MRDDADAASGLRGELQAPLDGGFERRAPQGNRAMKTGTQHLLGGPQRIDAILRRDPQQLVQIDTGIAQRRGIRNVGWGDQRHMAPGPGQPRQQRHHQGKAQAGFVAHDLAQRAHRPAAEQGQVQGGDAGGFRIRPAAAQAAPDAGDGVYIDATAQCRIGGGGDGTDGGGKHVQILYKRTVKEQEAVNPIQGSSVTIF